MTCDWALWHCTACFAQNALRIICLSWGLHSHPVSDAEKKKKNINESFFKVGMVFVSLKAYFFLLWIYILLDLKASVLFYLSKGHEPHWSSVVHEAVWFIFLGLCPQSLLSLTKRSVVWVATVQKVRIHSFFVCLFYSMVSQKHGGILCRTKKLLFFKLITRWTFPCFNKV